MPKLFSLFLLLAASTTLSFAHHPDDGITLSHFQSNLRPHGEWVLTEYGISAWRPIHVGVGWRPYMVGRWIWSPRGWYWSSREAWAWATYHYGRWHLDPLYGWVWIPGYEWAPAWVEWRYGDDCVGWAPLGYYANSFALTVRWSTPHSWWSFVDSRYMTSSSVDRFVYKSGENDRHIRRTRSIGNARREDGIVHSGGPRFLDIERRTGREIERIDIPDRVRPDRQRERRLEKRMQQDKREPKESTRKAGRTHEDSQIERKGSGRENEDTERKSRGSSGQGRERKR